MSTVLTDEQIVKVEKALDIKLYEWQRMLLQSSSSVSVEIPKDRGIGRTLMYCINLAMTIGKPINKQDIWEYSDWHGRYGRHYDELFFKDMFLDIWSKLRDVGLPVRHITTRNYDGNRVINKDI
ncbi:hypothetical protein [Clostridium estertheticum]|uniref:Uncharacterized protein n=1 Tax=Clostridium estertheticum subsp. estertheticum TaxID=1552 RepID=A0A1J0GJS7_9CLOT|nr:hypothetical protein [Clostridium estertheticum]APC41535.1 hypothetical protein A7L45_16350 [Clostridium estertheticum subsp. estertheticum]